MCSFSEHSLSTGFGFHNRLICVKINMSLTSKRYAVVGLLAPAERIAPLIHSRKGGDAMMSDFEMIMIVLTIFLIVFAAHNKK